MHGVGDKTQKTIKPPYTKAMNKQVTPGTIATHNRLQTQVKVTKVTATLVHFIIESVGSAIGIQQGQKDRTSVQNFNMSYSITSPTVKERLSTGANVSYDEYSKEIDELMAPTVKEELSIAEKIAKAFKDHEGREATSSDIIVAHLEDIGATQISKLCDVDTRQSKVNTWINLWNVKGNLVAILHYRNGGYDLLASVNGNVEKGIVKDIDYLNSL